MVAFVGFLGQHAATGKSPIAALADHVANPWVSRGPLSRDLST